MTPSWFLLARAIKHNHKPTATPPSIVIADEYNHFFPPLDDANDNDSDPTDLMGKYDGRGKKKGKGWHHCRYKDDDNIKALHGIYEEPKDDDNDGHDNDDNSGDWYGMDYKEREEDNKDYDDVVDITAVQLFGMPDKEFFGK